MENFPDNLENFTDSLENFPDNPENFSDTPENFPDNLENFPDHPENFLDNLENFPDNPENFLDNMENFSDNPYYNPHAKNFPDAQKLSERAKTCRRAMLARWRGISVSVSHVSMPFAVPKPKQKHTLRLA